jgi:mono/diheme cytochrome c family protein
VRLNKGGKRLTAGTRDKARPRPSRVTRRRLAWSIGASLATALLVGMLTKGMGFTARGEPSSLESKTMLAARQWATPRSARDQVNPLQATDDVLSDGMAHWADHCATCHANDGGGKTEIGKGLYPPAPDMREVRTQGLTDGELFYIIERGIPLTGMPAWGTGMSEGESESWKLVRFIRHLPQLTDKELAEMEKLNPKSAGQIEEERRINDFLKGKGGP